MSRENPDQIYDVHSSEILEKLRNCTDIICLLLFIGFIVVQVGVSILAYLSGDPQQLVLPHDSTGALCTSPNSNLFFFNLLTCINVKSLLNGCPTTQVCVSQCPTQNLFYAIDSHRTILLQNYCVSSSLIAKYGSLPTASQVSIAQYTDLVNSNICPFYAIESSPVFQRCIPSLISSVITSVQNLTATDNSTNTTQTIIDINSNTPITNQLISSAVNYISKLVNIQTVGQYVLEDFYSAAVLIIVLLLIAAVVSFIYIVITRWIVAPMIAISLIGIIALFVFATWFCITQYLELRTNSVSTSTFQVSLDYTYYLQLSSTWLAFGIISGIILIIIILLVLFLIKRLRLAIGLIGEASKAVSSLVLIVLWPILAFILQMAALAYNISVAVFLASAAKALYRVTNTTALSANTTFKVGDSCTPATFDNQSQNASCVFYRYGYGDPFSSVETTPVINFLNDYQWLPQFYNLFMFFWFQSFIIGFNQMVLAGCFSIWFWSKSKKCCIGCTSIKDTLVYHLGSIAFGSLVISIVKFIRAIIEFVENRLKKSTNNNRAANCCVTFCFCCCKCCFWCLEKFLKFLSRNAYVMVAIYGKNFCSSARDALTLLASNPLRALVIDRVTDFILFLGKVLITAGVGVLAFYFFSKKLYVAPSWTQYFAPDLHYYWLPLLIVIIATYFIAKIFFTVFEMAVDTLFLCALKDLEVNDGSSEKPYMMSTELKKLLSVKNTKKSSVGPTEPGDKKNEKI
jgi:choline transporter-like protein 2/4/5